MNGVDQRATPEGGTDETKELLRRIMRRQARLSLRVAAVFIVLLVLLPIANLMLPDAFGTNIGGFTFTWLFLGVLFYPITWLLSRYFVKESERLESAIAREEGGAK